jgi:acyl-CoA synthetase (AMP-forming)/AMP-acid ligase II
MVTGGALISCMAQLRATHACMTPTMWALRGGRSGRSASSSSNSNIASGISSSGGGNSSGNNYSSTISAADVAASLGLLPELRELSLGGEPTPASLVAQWRQYTRDTGEHAPRLVNIYGVTECTVYQSSMVLSDPCVSGADARLPRIVGPPFAGTRLGLLCEGAQVRWLPWAPEDDNGAPEQPRGLRPDAPGPCEHELLDRVEGEIVLGGAQVGEGYLGRAELTAERFVSYEGRTVFRTGDLGKLCWVEYADGPPSRHRNAGPKCSCGRYLGPLLSWMGRADSQVKLRGVRVELEEVENVLQRCRPLVALAVVVKQREQLVAFVTAPAGASAEAGAMPVPAPACVPGGCSGTLAVSGSPELPRDSASLGLGVQSLPRASEIALRAFVSRHLPALMVPHRFVRVDSFAAATSANGKLDRRVLAHVDVPAARSLLGVVAAEGPAASSSQSSSKEAQEGEEEEEEEEEAVAALSPLESLIARLWSSALELDPSVPIGPLDSFAQLGGDSLDAQRVSHDLISLLDRAAPEDARVQALRYAAHTFGELGSGLEPVLLLQAPSLRAYVLGLERTALASLLHDVTMQRELQNKQAPVGPGSLGASSYEALALYAAAGAGDVASVDVLSDPALVGLHPDLGSSRESRARTPLHAACAAGHAAVVRLLLLRGASCFAVTPQGLHAAHLAAACPGPDAAVVDMLCALCDSMRARGVASPAAVRDSRRQTLVHAAARGGCAAGLELLLAHAGGRLVVESLDRWHRTALSWAVVNGHEASVRVLLAAGADPRGPWVKQSSKAKGTHLPFETPLDVARRHGKLAILDLLQRANSEL